MSETRTRVDISMEMQQLNDQAENRHQELMGILGQILDELRKQTEPEIIMKVQPQPIRLPDDKNVIGGG